MAATPYHVADAFLQGRYAKAGNFYSTGDAIYSYALKLAHWDGDSIVIDHRLDGSDNVSVTTARHIRAIASCLAGEYRTTVDKLLPGSASFTRYR